MLRNTFAIILAVALGVITVVKTNAYYLSGADNEVMGMVAHYDDHWQIPQPVTHTDLAPTLTVNQSVKVIEQKPSFFRWLFGRSRPR